VAPITGSESGHLPAASPPDFDVRLGTVDSFVPIPLAGVVLWFEGADTSSTAHALKGAIETGTILVLGLSGNNRTVVSLAAVGPLRVLDAWGGTDLNLVKMESLSVLV
jgi:hypothetical protein